MTISHPGFCKICGQATHDIQRQYPIGHPLAGRPTAIGKPFADIVKVHLVLTNGTWATMQVHGDCVDLIHSESLPEIWRTALETMRFEEDNRTILGAKPLNPKQKNQQKKNILKLASSVPLGVMCVTPLEN